MEQILWSMYLWGVVSGIALGVMLDRLVQWLCTPWQDGW
jgi:F420-0:gamma-glutamyl ligase-like protein